MCDCGPVTATAAGSVGADWMDEIFTVQPVYDRVGRDALEIKCSVAGTTYTVVAEYVPMGAVPPTGLVCMIARRWANTKVELDLMVS